MPYVSTALTSAVTDAPGQLLKGDGPGNIIADHPTGRQEKIISQGPPEFKLGDPAASRRASAGAGENYAGFRESLAEAETAPEATTRKKPLRREDVLRPLFTALGVPLYQGRVKGKKRPGFYRLRLEEVRIKKMAGAGKFYDGAILAKARVPS